MGGEEKKHSVSKGDELEEKQRKLKQEYKKAFELERHLREQHTHQ